MIDMHPVPDYESTIDETTTREQIEAAIKKHCDNSKRQLEELFGKEELNRKFEILDSSWNYGQCGFCGCKTNAKRRACCDKGAEEDNKIL